MALRYALALPLMITAATAALAQDSTDCRNGLFPAQAPFALAAVRGDERAFFHTDMNGCPWTRGACSGPDYVEPGDLVLISRIRSGYACTYYAGEESGFTGWVPSRQLRLLAFEQNPSASAWEGSWSSFGNPVIAIGSRIGTLTVTGQSFWRAPPRSTDPVSTYIGKLNGQLTLTGHTAKYADGDLCQVNFTLLGPYLITGTNRKCSDDNVIFSGVYLRAD